MKLIKKILQFIKAPFYFLKINLYKFKSVEDLVDFTQNRSGGFIRQMQISSEITSLLNRLENEDIKNILEIGTARGGTLFSFSKVSSGESKLISIDLPKGDFGDGYSFLKIPLFKSFASKDKKIYLIRKDSHKGITLDEVKEILSDQKLDFLFIDGDHTYDGVKKDFEMYSSLVKEGGLIAFHDIVDGPKENVGGVPRFWQEVKNEHKYEEFIEDPLQGGYGIGLIKI
ncbi:MAG: class I SAM-dependent methyltransferase [Candidatus Paceibacterota bacterium]